MSGYLYNRRIEFISNRNAPYYQKIPLEYCGIPLEYWTMTLEYWGMTMEFLWKLFHLQCCGLLIPKWF